MRNYGFEFCRKVAEKSEAQNISVHLWSTKLCLRHWNFDMCIKHIPINYRAKRTQAILVVIPSLSELLVSLKSYCGKKLVRSVRITTARCRKVNCRIVPTCRHTRAESQRGGLQNYLNFECHFPQHYIKTLQVRYHRDNALDRVFINSCHLLTQGYADVCYNNFQLSTYVCSTRWSHSRSRPQFVFENTGNV